LYQRFVNIISDVSFLELLSNTLVFTSLLFLHIHLMYNLLHFDKVIIIIVVVIVTTVPYWQWLRCNFGYAALLV